MKKQFYFKDFNPDSDIERCYSEKHFQEYMKENGLSEMVVYRAKRITGADFFYCKKFDDIGEKGESCGRECSEYTPRNGKSGICVHNKPCYEPSDKIILKINQP